MREFSVGVGEAEMRVVKKRRRERREVVFIVDAMVVLLRLEFVAKQLTDPVLTFWKVLLSRLDETRRKWSL